MSEKLNIKNPPIVESTVEIRFQDSLSSETILGEFYYGQVKRVYEHMIQLPAANLPPEILSSNDVFKYSPHYEFTSSTNSNLIVRIGPNVVLIKYQKYHNNQEIVYPGWEEFIYKQIQYILSSIVDKISRVNRVNLRSINFFENDILPQLNFEINTNLDIDILSKVFIRFGCKVDDFENKIIISNDVSLSKDDNNKLSGSSIDIDTFIKCDQQMDIFSFLQSVISDIHSTNKNIFFKLLQDSYITRL